MRGRYVVTRVVYFSGALLALGAAVLWAYWPGLTGPFLFDDYSNLSLLKMIGGDLHADSLRDYFMASNSGPTGRPISMASFLLNDFSWPSVAEPFKYTNLLLHLINGLLVCWVTYLLLLRSGGVQRQETAFYVSIFLAAFWLLNPYQMSSVMYVIQRMALMSVFFVLSGLVFYIKGRCALEQGRVVPAYALILFGYFWGAVVGIFAKENAVIFVLLVPLIEVFFFSNQEKKRDWFLKLIILFPLACFFLMLLLQWPGHKIEYELIRDFTIQERLLSQGRAVGYYLLRYLVPGVGYVGVLADGFDKSTALFSPPSTAIFLLLHVSLLVVAVLLRRALPLFSFGVLFFYVAHLLESTYLPLELLFEHRNYLPSIFLVLGLAHLSWSRGWLLIGGAVIFACIILTRVQAGFWSNEHDLKAIMMVENPSSERAALVFAEYVQRALGHKDAISVIEDYRKINGVGTEGATNLIKLQCLAGEDNQQSFELLKSSVRTYRGKAVFLAQQVREIGALVVSQRCNYLSLDMLQEFVDAYYEYWPKNELLDQTYLISSAHIKLIGGDYQGFKYLMYRALEVTRNPELDLDVCNWFESAGQREDACYCYNVRRPESWEMVDFSRNKLRRFYGYNEKIQGGFSSGIERSCSN